MKPVDRQKMCSNCDGRIDIEAEVCPYCTAAQAPAAAAESPDQLPLFKQQSLQDSLTSLYTPPYSSRNLRYSLGEEENAAPQQPQQRQEAPAYKEVASRMSPAAAVAAPMEAEADSSSNHFWPLLMLSVGSVLATVGLLQFFFSDNGVLRLEWDSSYWFLYCLISLPLFFFGYKKLNQLK